MNDALNLIASDLLEPGSNIRSHGLSISQKWREGASIIIPPVATLVQFRARVRAGEKEIVFKPLSQACSLLVWRATRGHALLGPHQPSITGLGFPLPRDFQEGSIKRRRDRKNSGRSFHATGASGSGCFYWCRKRDSNPRPHHYEFQSASFADISKSTPSYDFFFYINAIGFPIALREDP